MLCALVGEETQTKLFDATKALKLRGIDQPHHQLTFIGVSAQSNYVVNWIAIDSFGQINSRLSRSESVRESLSRHAAGERSWSATLSRFAQHQCMAQTSRH